MTVGRRELFGWGALGLGVMATEGCGGALPSGRAATAGPEDVERLLAELDHVVLQLESMNADAEQLGIKARGAEARAKTAAGREECIRLLTTLCLMGTYRDVPEAVWREPRVEQRLARTLPHINAVLTAARNHLAEMSDDEVARIDKKLLAEPDLTMRITERIDDFAKEIHVPMEQRTYLRMTTAQLAARFRYEGTHEVTSKLAGKYDRLLSSRMSELGIEPRDLVADGGRDTWLTASTSRTGRQNLLGSPSESRLGSEGESCQSSSDCEDPLECAHGVCTTDEKPRSEQLMLTAGKVAKWGAIMLIPPLCGIGALMLLTDLFMVIVAGCIYASEG